MGNRNHEIDAMLRELAELTVLAEEHAQSFRARAYERARHALQGVHEDLSSMSLSELQKIDGIGKATAHKIREHFDAGTVAKLEALRERFPGSVVELSKIPGVGPKTLRRMREVLGIEDLGDLKRAIEAEQLRTLEGLGPKAEAKIARAIDRLGLKSGERRTPIVRAMRVAEQLVAEVVELPGVELAVPCGSLRRQVETVGDVDIVVGSTQPGPVMDWFVAHRLAHEVLIHGATKSSVVTRSGLQVDLRVVEPDQVGAATMYFTGSKAHNIRLRQLAQTKGWILNEYALAEVGSGEVVASRSEDEIYTALGLQFVPPPMREDTGEVEAAMEGTLPEWVRPDDLRGDLHIHTERSGDARSTLEDMVEEALRRGYGYLAITDHAENLPINGVSRDELRRQFDEMARLEDEHPQIRLLRGCELNIGGDGSLDYDPEFRAEMDWCIAAVHSHFDLPQAAQTKRLLRAIEDPSVRVVGHLTGRMIGRRPGIDLDLDVVLDALVEHGVALEINSALPRLDAAAPVLRRAVERGVTFVISTDSHHVSEMARRAPFGARQAQRGWVPRARVANTWDRATFCSWLARSRP